MAGTSPTPSPMGRGMGRGLGRPAKSNLGNLSSSKPVVLWAHDPTPPSSQRTGSGSGSRFRLAGTSRLFPDHFDPPLFPGSDPPSSEDGGLVKVLGCLAWAIHQLPGQLDPLPPPTEGAGGGGLWSAILCWGTSELASWPIHQLPPPRSATLYGGIPPRRPLHGAPQCHPGPTFPSGPWLFLRP